MSHCNTSVTFTVSEMSSCTFCVSLQWNIYIHAAETRQN